jgi:hypothetical protein
MNITSSPSIKATGCIACQPSTILRGLSHASSVLSETAKKLAFIASIYFMKAAAFTHTALNGAWSVTKTLGHNTAELAKRIGSALLVFSHIAAIKTVQFSIALAHGIKTASIVAGIYLCKAARITGAALHMSWVAAKNFGGKTLEVVKIVALAVIALLKKCGTHIAHVSQKVGQFSAKYFLIAAHYAAKRCSDAKTGIVEGFKMSRLFFATHKKETALVGCGIAVGAGAYYVAQRLFAGSKKADAQSNAV